MFNLGRRDFIFFSIATYLSGIKYVEANPLALFRGLLFVYRVYSFGKKANKAIKWASRINRSIKATNFNRKNMESLRDRMVSDMANDHIDEYIVNRVSDIISNRISWNNNSDVPSMLLANFTDNELDHFVSESAILNQNTSNNNIYLNVVNISDEYATDEIVILLLNVDDNIIEDRYELKLTMKPKAKIIKQLIMSNFKQKGRKKIFCEPLKKTGYLNGLYFPSREFTVI